MSNYDISYVFKAIDDFSPALKKINEAMSNFEKQTKKTEDRFKKFTDTVSKAGKFMFTRMALPLIGFAGYALKNSEQLKMAEIRLRAFTKTSADTVKLMAYARSEAMRTGIATEDLLSPAQILASRGLSTTDIQKRVSQLTTMALGTGKDFSELGARYANWVSRGFATGRELRSMPIILNKLRDMATKKGWSEAMFRKAISAKIGIDTLNKALDILTEKNSNLSKSAAEARGTTENSWRRIHETVRLMSADLGNSLISTLGLDVHMKNIADALDQAEPKLKAWLEANPDLVKMGTALAGIFVATTGIAASIKTVVWGFNLLAASCKTIAAASGPLLAVMAMWEGFNFEAVKTMGESIVMGLAQAQSGDVLGGMKTLKAGFVKGGELVGTSEANNSLVQGAGNLLMPQRVNVNLNTTAPDYITLRNTNGGNMGAIQLQTRASLGAYPIAAGSY